ncbi:holo-ACP synthase [Flagellimonas algicola]|uniref:Holo-[acyl-carrier-protein] synthase n=1 Tax=Flagellimonas algicola TaxID=2583815 RepID=A0ABY2WIZ8_9FLAO|nr:holo-ACP synthase [Allomuricauda algicola]TMU54818.1 holo-[acyl-carrier-protein] synthase [Allomuricauda algicola]
MIIGVGCDITDFSIAEKLGWNSNQKILNRIFSKREIESYHKLGKLTYLTGRFAVKESVLKCLGTGMYDGISLNEIEIIQQKSGKPQIILKGEVKKLSLDLGINKWFVSITHSSNCSMAYVIAES